MTATQEGHNELRENGRDSGREGGRGGRGRGRRPERSPRIDENGQPLENAQAPLGFAESSANGNANAGANTSGAGAEMTQPGADSNAAGEGREKRSRDRYGRERGPRQDRGDRPERGDNVPGHRDDAAPQLDAARTAPVATPQAVHAPAPTAAAPVVKHAAAPVAIPASVAKANVGMPSIASYALPTDSLVQVAQESGLQWVNSDPARIAAVQAAITAESKPVHVPRERPARVVVEQSPLVLVETKRDLGNMTLPFEQTPNA